MGKWLFTNENAAFNTNAATRMKTALGFEFQHKRLALNEPLPLLVGFMIKHGLDKHKVSNKKHTHSHT